MKELISAVIFLVGLGGVSYATKHIYVEIRQAALEKASHGLPSLLDFNRHLHERKPDYYQHR